MEEEAGDKETDEAGDKKPGDKAIRDKKPGDKATRDKPKASINCLILIILYLLS